MIFGTVDPFPLGNAVFTVTALAYSYSKPSYIITRVALSTLFGGQVGGWVFSRSCHKYSERSVIDAIVNSLKSIVCYAGAAGTICAVYEIGKVLFSPKR